MSVYRKLLRSERGNTMMIVAAVMPLLVGAGAVGIDVAQWALAKRQLQRIADTGAIAGANGLLQKGDQASAEAAEKAAKQSLQHNTQLDGTTVLIESAPSAGAPYAGDTSAVRVVVSATPTLSFVSFFISGPTTISAEATAKALPDPRYCFLALDDSPSSPGFDLSGASGITTDCGLMSNSRKKPSAYEFGGNRALLTAPTISSTGALGQGITLRAQSFFRSKRRNKIHTRMHPMRAATAPRATAARFPSRVGRGITSNLPPVAGPTSRSSATSCWPQAFTW